MSDGVELVGEAYLPAQGRQWATLLRKTPYDRNLRTEADYYLVAQGFAVVVVSQRGRHGSGGRFYQFRNEAIDHRDGYDTIEFVAAQPWSTGRVGTFGVSSDGQWQLSAAGLRPPSLRAMFVSYAANPRAGRVEHGAYLNTVPAWSSMVGAFARPLASPDDWADWLADWKQSRLPLLASFVTPEVLDGFVHLAADEYWAEMDPAARYDGVDVPVYHECGWYDRYLTPTFRNFTLLQERGAEPGRSAQKVVVGPWLHGGRAPEPSPGAEIGPSVGQVERLALQAAWFGHWLRDEATGVLDLAPVRAFVLNADRWWEGDEWPPPANPRRWYLHGDGSLRDVPPDDDGGSTPFDHDPYDPLPTIGGHGGVGWQWTTGPRDQRPREERSVTFTSAVLASDVLVIGDPVAHLWGSSSAVDTDFVITLTDVAPTGESCLVRQGAMRASFREGMNRQVPLEPGTPYEFAIRLDPISTLYRAGHRIRLSVASSSFPAYLPNPGTLEPLHLATEALSAVNRVHHSPTYASTLELPVVEA